MLSKKSSVSRRKAWRSVSSKSGKDALHRNDGLEVAQEQPLAGEVGDERVGAPVGEHPPHLRAEHRGLAQLASLGGRQQLIVGNAAPQKERQPRRELEVADAIRRSGRGVRRIALDAEQELGADEQAPYRALDARVEALSS